MQQDLAQSVLERSALGGTWTYEIAADRLHWSAGTFRVWGLDPQATQPTAMECFSWCMPESQPRIEKAVKAAMRHGTSWDLDLEIVTRDGRQRRIRSTGEATVENGRAVNLYGSYIDVGERVLMAQENRRISDELEHRALHDSLTDLPNRDFIDAELARRIERVRSGGPGNALLYLDLDRFKLINDACGHTEGDRLLREMAASLGEQRREGDVLARLGGDEFALVLGDSTPQAASATAARLITAVGASRFKSGAFSYPLSLSIGIAMIDAGTTDVAEVMSQADTACFIAKYRGRGRAQLYQRGDEEVANTQRDINWAARIDDAIDNNHIEVHAQRIVSLAAGTMPSYETLIRLRSDNGLLILPGDFLPAAQRFGLMGKIDRHVVQQVLTKIAALEREGNRSYGYVSINLSGSSISDYEFASFLMHELDSRRIPAHCVRFEITETTAISEHAGARDLIARLRAAGYKILLDDFGTGFTSFNYLKTLGVDGFKIDQSYTHALASDETNRAIVEALCTLGNRLKLEIIAEGVEDQATLDALVALGVQHIQGWLFHKAEPLERLLPATTKREQPPIRVGAGRSQLRASA